MSQFHVERIEINRWFDRCIKLSRILVVTGIRGSGKSTAVKNWVSAQINESTNIHWTTFVRFKSLSEVLNIEAKDSSEEILKLLHVKYKNDFFIWDDIHFLNNEQKSVLMSAILKSESKLATPACIAAKMLTKAILDVS